VCGSTEHLARFHKKGNLPTEPKNDKILTTTDSRVNEDEWESEYGLNEHAYIVVKNKKSRVDKRDKEGRVDSIDRHGSNTHPNIKSTVDHITETKHCGSNRICLMIKEYQAADSEYVTADELKALIPRLDGLRRLPTRTELDQQLDLAHHRTICATSKIRWKVTACW